MTYSRTEPLHVTQPARFFPADRIAPIVEAYIARADAERPSNTRTATRDEGEPGCPFAGIREVLATEAGVSTKWIQRILNGESKSAEIASVDRVLLAMGRTDLLYLPPEQGGLADLYFAADVIGGDDGREVAEVGLAYLDLRPPQSQAFRDASLRHRERLAAMREAA